MTLRELLIERILFVLTPNELVDKYSIVDENFDDISDLDLFELYEELYNFEG